MSAFSLLVLLHPAKLLAPDALLPPLPPLGRRAAVAAACGFALSAPRPAGALIKGSAPPPKMAVKERKCKSIDECEALGEKAKAEAAASERTDFERTAGGDRYRDLIEGSGKAAAQGDTIEMR